LWKNNLNIGLNKKTCIFKTMVDKDESSVYNSKSRYRQASH